jgi:hypothetical protein
VRKESAARLLVVQLVRSRSRARREGRPRDHAGPVERLCNTGATRRDVLGPADRRTVRGRLRAVTSDWLPAGHVSISAAQAARGPRPRGFQHLPANRRSIPVVTSVLLGRRGRALPGSRSAPAPPRVDRTGRDLSTFEFTPAWRGRRASWCVPVVAPSVRDAHDTAHDRAGHLGGSTTSPAPEVTHRGTVGDTGAPRRRGGRGPCSGACPSRAR